MSQGVWLCDQCGNANDTESWPCEECRYPLVHVTQKARTETFKRESEEVLEMKPVKWECSHCKTLNMKDEDRCVSCFTKRGASEKEKLKATAKGIRLQQSMDDIFLSIRTSEAEQLKGTIPDHFNDNWKNESLIIEEGIYSNVIVRDLLGEHPRACDVGGAIVLQDKKSRIVGVFFRVLAPNAEKVAVVGDWNGWCQEYMFREGDFWKLIVPGALPGQKYNYIIQYYDKKLDSPVSEYRADPRGEILHFTDRRWVSEIYNHRSFQWTDQHHIPKSANQMVMYELHVGTFCSSGCSSDHFGDESVDYPSKIGTFNEITTKLDYFTELGINTLALLPVTQDAHMKPFNCWGYDPVSLWAVHADYGTPDDLKNLINTAHMLGISVIIDFVPNHLSGENILQFFDGPEDIYFPKDPEIKTTDWGPRLDFSSKRVRNYVVDAVESWLRDFHFDGVRVDSTCNIRGFMANGTTKIHPDGWILLQELTDMVRLKFPNCISIAEDLQDYESKLNHGGAGFDCQWDDRFFKSVLQTVVTVSDKHRNVRNLAEVVCMASLPGCDAGGRVIFTENHDTVPEDRQGRIPAAILRGNRAEWPSCSLVETNYYSLKRTALSLSILFTSPGIPMLLQGQELFETCAPCWPFGPLVDFSRKERMNPPMGFFYFCSELCALRTNERGTTKGLSGNYARVFHINDVNDNRLIVYHRWTHGGPSDDVIVIVNCCNIHYEEYWMGFPRFGQWKLRFTSDSSRYSAEFSDIVSDEYVETIKSPKDGYPYSGSVCIGPYSTLIYSQDTKSTVQFVLHYKIGSSDQVKVVGSTVELGGWDVNAAILLYSDHTHRWRSPQIDVPLNQVIEFKFIIISQQRDRGSVSWQVGDNNYFIADNGNRNYEVDCRNISFQ